MSIGYWPDKYWPDVYWPEIYWPEYGAVTSVAFPFTFTPEGEFSITHAPGGEFSGTSDGPDDSTRCGQSALD